MTDIREQAAKAAREWAETHGSTSVRDYSGRGAFSAGYLAGYEAAKADLTEARNKEPRWRDHGNG